jgi:hypothetical protein
MPDASMLMSMVRDARTGFVDKKWDELLSLVDDQANAIERVRAVHQMQIIDGYEHCYACLNHEDHGSVWQQWPCETIAALNGDTE